MPHCSVTNLRIGFGFEVILERGESTSERSKRPEQLEGVTLVYRSACCMSHTWVSYHDQFAHNHKYYKLALSVTCRNMKPQGIQCLLGHRKRSVAEKRAFHVTLCRRTQVVRSSPS